MTTKLEGGDDPFNKWFARFSTEHSWYKTGAECGYFLLPKNDRDYPWTLHSWWLPKDLPCDVRSMIESCKTPINGLIYGRHGGGHGLFITVCDAGWPFIDYLRHKGYDEAARILKQRSTDNSAQNDSRYKIVLDTGGLDTKKGVIWDLFCREYDRMRSLARENYYCLLSRLYPWLRRRSKDTKLGPLTYIANQYQKHIESIKFASDELKILPNVIIDICIEYHHTF